MKVASAIWSILRATDAGVERHVWIRGTIDTPHK